MFKIIYIYTHQHTTYTLSPALSHKSRVNWSQNISNPKSIWSHYWKTAYFYNSFVDKFIRSHIPPPPVIIMGGTDPDNCVTISNNCHKCNLYHIRARLSPSSPIIRIAHSFIYYQYWSCHNNFIASTLVTVMMEGLWIVFFTLSFTYLKSNYASNSGKP